MNKRYLAALALLAVALTSCAAKPPTPAESQEPPAASQELAVSQEPAVPQPQGPEEMNGTWELIEADYQAPTRGSRLDNIEIPDYNGMDEDAFYDRAYELGFNSETGPYPVWAEGMMLSNIGRYVVYSSNKDCLDPPNYTGSSVFLLDVATGEETVLLSGADGHSYGCMNWLDEEHMLCVDEERNYYLCNVDSGAIQLDHPFESNWGPLGFRYSTFVEQVGQELRMVHVERDSTGAVTELARAPFDGEQVKTCAISGDGSYVCYILQKDMMSFDRYIVLWNTATGQMTEIEPPQMTVGEDNMGAVGVELWYSWAFAVEFNVADAPEPNGHSELWTYSCDVLNTRELPLDFADRELEISSAN